MKAVVLKKTCKADDLKVTFTAKPEVKEGWVLVKVKAFGINHSELLLRDHEADCDYIKLPIIPGIECVGEIIDNSNSDFNLGDIVIALMGGMGRSFNGSYSEFALLPIKNVFSVNKNLIEHLSLEEFASIPETFFTVYGSLFESLRLNSEDILLIRGGTSSAGICAIQLAKSIGCKIIATTRNIERIEILKEYGADYVIIDDGKIYDKVIEIYPEKVTKVLELVGPKTLKDSMRCLRYHGIICVTGILGDEENIKEFDPIKDILNGIYLTSFFSNFPNQEIIDKLFKHIHDHNIKPIVSKVYKLDEISNAHKLMEDNKTVGKIVIKVVED